MSLMPILGPYISSEWLMPLHWEVHKLGCPGQAQPAHLQSRQQLSDIGLYPATCPADKALHFIHSPAAFLPLCAAQLIQQPAGNAGADVSPRQELIRIKGCRCVLYSSCSPTLASSSLGLGSGCPTHLSCGNHLQFYNSMRIKCSLCKNALGWSNRQIHVRTAEEGHEHRQTASPAGNFGCQLHQGHQTRACISTWHQDRQAWQTPFLLVRNSKQRLGTFYCRYNCAEPSLAGK